MKQEFNKIGINAKNTPIQQANQFKRLWLVKKYHQLKN